MSTWSEDFEFVESLAAATSTTDKNQKCVLLIEDNEDSMVLVRYALDKYGDGSYRLEWFTTLKAGLERLRRGGVDLVVLDLGLPDAAGFASSSWVRAVDPTVPILVLSGDDREDTQEDVFCVGIEGYLVKGLTSGPRLVAAIRQTLLAQEEKS